MLFGEYDEDFAKTFQDTFKELQSIRFLRLFKNSIKYLPPNFPKLLLDIGSWPGELPKGLGFSRLVNLRHLIVSSSVHSSIARVGKMEFLQNLIAFYVKKELSGGFELEELGSLKELGGTLSIGNLEKAKTGDEASKAKLDSKRTLACLKLSWDKNRSNIEPAEENDVLEGLKPNSSLSELHIENHGGTTCRSWLGSKIKVQNLRVLHLSGVSWNTSFPHFSKMKYLQKLELRNIDVLCSVEDTVFSYMGNRNFHNLVTLEIHGMKSLEKWVSDCCFFPSLEELRIEGCPKLTDLPFSQQCDGLSRNSQCFPKLLRLYISSCPLLSLPMPCTPTLQCVEFDKMETDDSLVYSDNQLKLVGKKKKLEYCNLEKLQKLTLVRSSHVSSKDLKMLTSLQALIFQGCSNVFLEEEDDSAFHLPAVRVLIINVCGVTGKELARLLGCFPALSYMQLRDCKGTGAKSENLLFISSDATKFRGSYLSNLWVLAAKQIPECTNIRFEPSDPHMYIVNSETQDSYNPEDILSYAQDDIMYFLAFPEIIFVDSVSGLLIRRICNRLGPSVRRVGFCFDNRVQSFTVEQNYLLRRVTYLHGLELHDCKSLQSLPEALRDMLFLKLIYIKNCPGIKSIGKDSLPESLEKLAIHNCTVELVEGCRKLEGGKLKVHIFS